MQLYYEVVERLQVKADILLTKQSVLYLHKNEFQNKT